MNFYRGIYDSLISIAASWIPGLSKLTGVFLILMLEGLLPANVYSAVNRVEFRGHCAGPLYLLVRIPFQLFAIWII
jgi:uncharacterized membrane protein